MELSNSSKAPNIEGRPVSLLAVENLTDLRRVLGIGLFSLGGSIIWEAELLDCEDVASVGTILSLGADSLSDPDGKGGKIEVRMLLTRVSSSRSTSVSSIKISKSCPSCNEVSSALSGLGS